METTLRLINEGVLFTHKTNKGVYVRINHPENPAMGGEGKDKGRLFNIFSDMYVIDSAHVRDKGDIFIMDKEDAALMRPITQEDDITLLGDIDPYSEID